MWHTWLGSQWQKRGVVAWILRPLSWIYRLVILVRESLFRLGVLKVFNLDVPVVIVGNIYVGGTGKTPAILSLIEELRARGWHPGLVSRGYGAKASPYPVCGRGEVSSQQFGDEPAMIAKKTDVPVAVYPDRPQAAQALLAFDPMVDVILSDDGLQHWRLGRDIEILVQDERGTGNGLVLPAGPLREPAARLKRVNVVLTRRSVCNLSKSTRGANIVRADFAVKVDRFRHLGTGHEVLPEDFSRNMAGSKGLLAVAGIGVPERFFADLRSLGIPPTRTLGLADHGHLDAAWLCEQPEQTILVTEKDAVKLLAPDQTASISDPTASVNPSTRFVDKRIWVGVAKSHWADKELFEWLDDRLKSWRSSH